MQERGGERRGGGLTLKKVRNLEGVVSSKVLNTLFFTSSRFERRSSAVDPRLFFRPEKL